MLVGVEESRCAHPELLGVPVEIARNPYHPNKLALPEHAGHVAALAIGSLVAPVTIEVDVADGFCNQRCVHCCFTSPDLKDPKLIDPEKLLLSLEQAYGLGTRAVELVGGGEPTTHPQISEIIRGIREIGSGDMEVGLITNGLLANRILDVAEQLSFVRISLDSVNPETYAKLHGVPKTQLARVMRNVHDLRQKLKQNDPTELLRPQRRLGLAYLVTPPVNHTSEEIEAAAEYAVDSGVDYLVYRPAQLNEIADVSQWTEANRAISDIKTRYNRLGDTAIFGVASSRWDSLTTDDKPSGKCDGKPLVAVIKADGSVAYCILRRNQRDIDLGNIYTQSFEEIWFSERHNELWRQIDRSGCPVPCKVNPYTDIIKRHNNGVRIDPPGRDEVDHRSFI